MTVSPGSSFSQAGGGYGAGTFKVKVDSAGVVSVLYRDELAAGPRVTLTAQVGALVERDAGKSSPHADGRPSLPVGSSYPLTAGRSIVAFSMDSRHSTVR